MENFSGILRDQRETELTTVSFYDYWINNPSRMALMMIIFMNVLSSNTVLLRSVL